MAGTERTDRTVTLERLARADTFGVVLEGESFPAPFSRRDCVWSEWIYNSADLPAESGFHSGESEGGDFRAKTEFGSLMIDSRTIRPYIAPSFEGGMMRKSEEVLVTEYCLETSRTYFARVEAATYSLPGFRFLPFVPRRRTVLLLVLSDRAFSGRRPVPPLVPTFRGMAWG